MIFTGPPSGDARYRCPKSFYTSTTPRVVFNEPQRSGDVPLFFSRLCAIVWSEEIARVVRKIWGATPRTVEGGEKEIPPRQQR